MSTGDQHDRPQPEIGEAILATPAVTSPSRLGPRRLALLTANRLKDLREAYDVVVIGSGLAGLTCANRLGREGYTVLLLEQHYNFGGLATWFKRQSGHIFDISLHGFPVGMIKTCRKYWSKEIADSIVQLKSVRFDNPQFSLETTFDRQDFTRILVQELGIEHSAVDAFFQAVRGMNFYDDAQLTTRQLFERFFPGRSDVARLLMEPIAYANGSTLDDPAITYGIVFSNFMSKGVYTFQGGTDVLIRAMKEELSKNGVDIRNYAQVEEILVERKGGEKPRAAGVVVNGVRVPARCVISNANVKTTVTKLVDASAWSEEFIAETRRVRMNSSSSQVYMGIRKGERIPFVGELLFTSTAPEFDSEALCALRCTSRTFSFYYPEIRPGTDRYTVVASINSNYRDWVEMDEETYLREKSKLANETVDSLERYVPAVREKIDHIEVSTPRTFEFYTQHEAATSFGTKFEGLKVSQELPKQVSGLFHAGSVGIIMSGWLGAANYGVIVANEVDRYLRSGLCTEAPGAVRPGRPGTPNRGRTRHMFDLSDQLAIVTGGTRGIGRAISQAFLGAGAQVLATYAGNRVAAEAFREGCGAPERLKVACFDVSDFGAVEHFFGELERPPQILVNNAGIRRDAIVGMMSADDWRRVLSVNLDGTFFMSKFAVMAMSRQKYGRIINIISPSARVGFPGQANYAASKAGQQAMVRVLAKEVAKRRITVNCVSPGFIDTELLADINEQQKAAFLEMVPLKRFGTAEEVASAVRFLASKEASYVTGTTLEVAGGI